MILSMHAFISLSPLHAWKSAFLGLFVLVLCLYSPSAEAQIYELTQLKQELRMMQDRVEYLNEQKLSQRDLGFLESRMDDLKEAQQALLENVRAEYDRNLVWVGIMVSVIGIIAPLWINSKAAEEMRKSQQNSRVRLKDEANYVRSIILEFEKKQNQTDELLADIAKLKEEAEQASKEAYVSEQKSKIYAESDPLKRFALINDLLQSYPKDDKLWVMRSFCNYQLTKYYAVIEDCNKAIELNPKDNVAYNNRGSAKNKIHDYIGAIEDCNKALELDSTNVQPYRQLGNAYRGLKRYDEALESFAKGIELLPVFDKFYSDRAETYREMAEQEADEQKAAELIKLAEADEKKAEELKKNP